MEVDIHRLSNFFFHIKKKTTTKKLMCGSLCENMCIIPHLRSRRLSENLY